MANQYAARNWARKELQARDEAIHRALDLLQRLVDDEPYTSRDVDTVMASLREAICKACRDGKPHTGAHFT